MLTSERVAELLREAAHDVYGEPTFSTITGSEIAELYAERTGGDQDAIRNLMFAETWMTAVEAKEFGFIDKIEELDDEKKAITESIERYKSNIETNLNSIK
jgi:enoyl-CoA hydratase/carnithine racemase